MDIITSETIPNKLVIDLLNIINRRDINGNKASGIELKQIIIDYVQDKLKVIVNRLEMQYEKSGYHLSQSRNSQ